LKRHVESKGEIKVSKVFFTSDTHFGHGNIIKYCNRPFKDVDEMNQALITNWNSVVQPNDIVYHLGDVGFTQPDKLRWILNRLNGSKILLLGNHDKQLARERSTGFGDAFQSIHDYLEININGNKIILSHYPMLTWNGSGHGSIMLHGHAHGNTNYGHLSKAKILDVGVDVHNYFPMSSDSVLLLMSKRIAEDYGRDRRSHD
jgi:calcineurin-like phosphoesterase family protein